MFKDIQKQLLLKYPLLWNTKFIPMVIVGVALNVIYFFIGYADGTLDFTKRYKSDIDFTFSSFSVLISLIILIIWLVSYFKNNSFKRYYTKSKNALFYEWIQILVIILLLSMFYFPFQFGKQLHKRMYLSEKEARERCETISSADFFIDGSFESAEVDKVNSVLRDSTVNGEYIPAETKYYDYVIIFGKKYSPTALINRNVGHYSFFNSDQDAAREIKIRKFLVSNNTFEVKKIMKDYFKILKEHHLPTNLTEDKWFQITYDYPDFKKFELINPVSPVKDSDPTDRYNYDETRVYSVGDLSYSDKVYSSYYIEHNVLKDNYEEISRAFTTPFFKFDEILVLLYCAFGFSMLIFSFRVTSGKSWLIALVGYGIFNIIIGIFAGLSGDFLTYPILLILSFLIILVYFISIVTAKQTKSKTAVVLNLIIWLFGGLIPVAYFTYIEIYQKNIDYHNYQYSYEDPYYEFLKDHIPMMFTINAILVIVGMFFLSRTIRTWKGIAEE